MVFFIEINNLVKRKNFKIGFKNCFTISKKRFEN